MDWPVGEESSGGGGRASDLAMSLSAPASPCVVSACVVGPSDRGGVVCSAGRGCCSELFAGAVAARSSLPGTVISVPVMSIPIIDRRIWWSQVCDTPGRWSRRPRRRGRPWASKLAQSVSSRPSTHSSQCSKPS